MPESLRRLFTADEQRALESVLALDPRPHYHDDSRSYGMPFGGYDIRFHVTDGVLTVDDWEEK
jgi:hypothetical protein